MQKKDPLITQEEIKELSKRIKEQKKLLGEDAEEKKKQLIKLWSYRSQTLPTYKHPLTVKLEEELALKMQQNEEDKKKKECNDLEKKNYQPPKVIQSQKLKSQRETRKDKVDRESVMQTELNNKKRLDRLKFTPIIYNGVEKMPPGAAVSSPLPAGEPKKGCISICFAARLEEQKGVRTLCEVVKSLGGDPRYHFYIFGDGTLRHLLDDLRQQQNVSIHGPVSGIAASLRLFDYVFMPSVHEGLATLSIEASLSRTPVLANKAPGLTDTLPPDWPLMVTGNDTEQWLHLFRDVLPKADREALAEQAFRYAESRFTLERMQEQYTKLYSTHN